MRELTQATGETEAPQTEQDAAASMQRLEDGKSFKESGKGSSAKSRITAVSASVAKQRLVDRPSPFKKKYAEQSHANL